MIPKIIHYCWLSDDPYPEKVQHCIESWKKIIPDYEFVLWDRKRFPIESVMWVKEAYMTKKYAYAADYIRLYALYHYGGIYLDSDVQVFKRFDDLLHLPYFIGKEAYDTREEVAAFGAEKGTTWLKKALDYYEGRHFIEPDGSLDMLVAPDVFHQVITSMYTIKEIQSISAFSNEDGVFYVFPKDWFCANVFLKKEDKISTPIVSENSYCIHLFMHSYKQAGPVKSKVRPFLMSIGVYKLLYYMKKHYNHLVLRGKN